MKRLALAVLSALVAAAALAAWGNAAPERGAAAAAPAAPAAAKLPPLPDEIKQRGRWNIGFDVEIAKWFSRFAFGRDNRVTYTCVTTPAREPAINSGRVDLVIATFTYTPDRDTRIDFSRAYYKATGRLLVRNDSPIRSLADIADRTVA